MAAKMSKYQSVLFNFYIETNASKASLVNCSISTITWTKTITITSMDIPFINNTFV